MEVFRGSWSNFTAVRDSVVTVGFFDGVHLGHRAILERLTEAARAQGLRSVVLTFDSHPRDVLQESGSPIKLLTTVDEKLPLLAASGVDLAMVIQFDHVLSQMSAADFVQIILKGRIGMKKIVLGFNHGFGKQRTGDRETLIALSKTLSFSVEVVNPARIGETIVSSTYLRDVIGDGYVEKATLGLGRFYSLSGTIVHGFGRGRRLGWPTANFGNLAPGKLCPRDGIYAGLTTVRGATYAAAISSGFNPTFAEGRHSIEAHLLDFDADIYDEVLELQFVERIRGEKKFASEAELSAQIGEDVQAVAAKLRELGLMRQVS